MFQLSNWFYVAAMTLVACGPSTFAAAPPQVGTITKDVDFFAPGKSNKTPSGTFSLGEKVKIIQSFSRGGTDYLRVVTRDGRDGYVVADAVAVAGIDKSHGAQNRDADTPLPIPSDPSRLNDLAINLMRSTLTPGQNLLISPYGIWSNLRIVQHGARGPAAEELARLIGAPLAVEKQTNIVHGIKTTDALLHRPEITFSDTFKSFIEAAGVELKETTFDDASRKQMNAWIADRSHGQIVNFFSPQSWNSDAAVIIANVAWMKQSWAFPFDSKLTEENLENKIESDFYLSEKDVIQVPMMGQTRSFETITSDMLDCDVVLMPYENEELVAVLIVPHRIDGLPELLKQIDGESFGAMIASVKPSKTLVVMPRFEFSADVNVLEALEKVGSNLSGLELTEVSNKVPVQVSEVVQKSRIQVDENGTEATSVTATGLIGSNAVGDQEPITKEVRANRPFLFAVQHRPSQSLLFLAAVVDPDNASHPKQAVNP